CGAYNGIVAAVTEHHVQLHARAPAGEAS
ncbi:MAG TPA: (2Fe-2S)-binding protein, partial [Massilia timonae]|nr:(2Fe-2S)-binding protein [Massilia timonae]